MKATRERKVFAGELEEISKTKRQESYKTQRREKEWISLPLFEILFQSLIILREILRKEGREGGVTAYNLL